MSQVEISRVGSQDGTYDLTQVSVRGFTEQMKMGRNQGVTVNVQMAESNCCGLQFQKSHSVSVVAKDFAAVDST